MFFRIARELQEVADRVSEMPKRLKPLEWEEGNCGKADEELIARSALLVNPGMWLYRVYRYEGYDVGIVGGDCLASAATIEAAKAACQADYERRVSELFEETA